LVAPPPDNAWPALVTWDRCSWMSGELISASTGGFVEVKGRRRVSEPGAWEAFIEELQNKLIQLKDSNPNVLVSDLDISQNKCTPEQFEQLFNALGFVGVKVQRFRMFGCPGFNDEAMQFLSDHMAKDLTSETAPAELHLSDCALTSDGFNLLMNAIEDNELYPTSVAKGRSVPLYLRLENNYIDEAVMQEKIDAGIIKRFKKTPGAHMEAAPGVKVNLVVQKESGSLQQKTGPPPSPEDAPPPKEVFDRSSSWSGGKGWDKGSSWNGKGPGSSWNGKGSKSAPTGQQWNVRPAMVRPMHVGPMMGAKPALGMMGKGAPMRPGVVRPGTGVIRPVVMQPRPVGEWNRAQSTGGAAAQTWPRGTSGTANDRSRTPAPPTKQPPKVVKPKLPYPWEEQWSEEYGIPYFWNADTGESVWETPAA